MIYLPGKLQAKSTCPNGTAYNFEVTFDQLWTAN